MIDFLYAGSYATPGSYRCTSCGNHLQVCTRVLLPSCPCCHHDTYRQAATVKPLSSPVRQAEDLSSLVPRLGLTTQIDKPAQPA
jgi:predicted  nucleic acid-binding Zn-ribbon protein